MGRKRPTPEQIITALREAAVGLARGKEPPGAYTYTACAARACTPGGLAKSKSPLWAAWRQKMFRWFNQFICI